MPYIVTTTNGTALATVPDNTVNTTTTSLTLVGKNYAGYGSFLNENYVKLLENFSNGIAPTAPITGQLWYDTTNTLLKVYTGSQWKQMHTSAAGSTAPSSPVTGDLWWDTTNLQLKVWGGSAWLGVGTTGGTSGGAGATTTGSLVDTIVDNTSASHVVVKFSISNNTIAIISKDATFTPQTAISGFAVINPGINLIASSVLPGSQFTGNASNALLLNNLSSSSFLRTDVNQSTTGTLDIVNDAGMTIGNTSTHTIFVSSGAMTFKNNTPYSDLNINVNKSGVSTRVVSFAANSAAMLPGVNNTTEIGSNSQKFANVWATTFRGQAITAQYADLAERFEADVPMIPGTVVQLGGVNEITAAIEELTEDVFGVISTNAGFLMNGGAGDNLTHPPVAVNGRVPVRVVGKIRKGDRLVSAGRGLARSALKTEITAFNVIGRSLEDKYTVDEGTVEAVVKLNN